MARLTFGYFYRPRLLWHCNRTYSSAMTKTCSTPSCISGKSLCFRATLISVSSWSCFSPGGDGDRGRKNRQRGRQSRLTESAPCVMSEDTTSTSSWQVNAATHLCRQPAILARSPPIFSKNTLRKTSAYINKHMASCTNTQDSLNLSNIPPVTVPTCTCWVKNKQFSNVTVSQPNAHYLLALPYSHAKSNLPIRGDQQNKKLVHSSDWTQFSA